MAVDLLDSDSGGESRSPGSRWRRAVVAIVAVVVVVGSSAFVLTRKNHHAAGAFNIEALAATTRRESARVIGTDTLPAGAFKEPVVVTTGVIDFRSGDGRLDIATRGSDGRLTRFETVLSVDGTFYIRIDASILDLPANIRRTKRWIESKKATASGVSGALNPFDPLATLEAHHVKIDDLGMTRLGNLPVHHYRGVLHTQYTPRSSNGPTVTVTSTVDLYVDTHNRLVRLHEVDRQPLGTSTSQADFSNYGIAVHVTAPPAGQVYVAPK